MSTEIIKIDDEQFGKLIELPALYAENMISVTTAVNHSTLQLETFNKVVKIQEVDAGLMVGYLAPITDLLGRFNDTLELIENGRKPHTVKMDAIKSLFTGMENTLKAEIVKLKAPFVEWEKEKIRRKKVQDELDIKALAKTNERIAKVNQIKTTMRERGSSVLLAEMTRLSEAYYSKSAEDLPSFSAAIEAYIPELEPDQYNKIFAAVPLTYLYNVDKEIEEIFIEALDTVQEDIESNYKKSLLSKISDLTLLVPARIEEIKAGDTAAANARIIKEAEDSKQQLLSDLQSSVQVDNQEADTKKLEASFDTVSAGPSLEKSAGTITKKKYEVTSHKAIIAIIQSWVTKDMKDLTPAEALTGTISKMITAGNKRLNEGERLEAPGLNVVDDVTVRTTRKTATV